MVRYKFLKYGAGTAWGDGEGARFARRTKLASLARALRAVVGMIRYIWHGGKHTNTVQL